MRRSFRPLALCLLVASACGDDSSASENETNSDETGSTPSFAADIQDVLEDNCICHFQAPDGTMTATVLTLNEGIGYDQLVDADSIQVSTMKRVAPGDIENSYLMHKLRGTHMDQGAPVDTDPMPPLAPLGEADLATFEAWILGGAPP